MQKNLYSLLVALCLSMLGIEQAWAQSAAFYNFSAKDSSYTAIVTDSSLIVSPPDDDDVYSDISVGFAFPWLGSSYGAITTTPNGVLAFGSSISGAFLSSNGNIFASGSTNNVLAFLNADLTSPATNNSDIAIKRGTQNGQKYFALQFTRVRRYDAGGGGPDGFPGDSINLQVWLWEGGRMNVFYGPSAIDASSDRTINVGLKGNSSADLLAVTGSFGSPTTSSVFASLPLSNAGVWRSAGRLFTFAPPAVLTNDVRLSEIVLNNLTSPLCSGSASQTISAKVTNLGTSPLPSVAVAYRLNNGTVRRQTVTFPTPLSHFQSRTISFSGALAANMSAAGAYNISLYSEQLLDDNRANDTLTYSITLGGDINLPSGRIFSTYAQQTSAAGNWIIASDVNGSRPYTAFSLSEFLSGSNSATSNFMSGFTDTTNVWLIRHGINYGDATQKSFSLSVAVGSNNFAGGINPASSIGDDDSLNILVSSDCGSSWTILKSFTITEFSAGEISNNFTSFTIPITGISANQGFSLAIQFNSGNTAASSSYSWFIDNSRFPSATDLAVDSVYVSGSTFSGCVLSPQQAIGVRVSNQGSSTITSATVGYRVNSGTLVSAVFPISLTASADTVLYFTGANGANLSTFNTYVFKAFATAAGDQAHDNDTTRRTLVIAAATGVIPVATTFQTIAELQTAGFGWYSGSPATIHRVSSNVFMSGFPPVWDETITATIPTSTAPNTVDWFIRPGYQLSGAPVGFEFSLLVSSNTFGATPITDIGDDTLSVVASNDCGASWRVLRKFSQADVASSFIDDTMRTQRVSVPFTSGSLIIGWKYDANNTAAPNPYRWQMDSVRFRAGVDVVLLSASGIPATASVCGNSIPLKFRYINNGTVRIDTVTVSYKIGTRAAVTQNVIRPLAPGGIDSVTFNSPIAYSGNGTVSVLIKVDARGDISLGNNGQTFSTVVTGTVNLPATAYGNFNSLTAAGFITGSGPNAADPTVGFQGSTSYTSFQPTAAAIVSSTATGYVETWLLSPIYKGQSGPSVNLRFKVSVAAGLTGTNTGAVIERDDSLSIFIRRNCGAWEFVQGFTGDDYRNGLISNALTPEVLQLTTVAQSDSFQVGFKVSNGGTPPSTSYRWHLNSIFITDVSGTHNNLTSLGLTLAPNPTTGVVQLSGVQKHAQVTVLDLMGRTLRSLTVTEASSKIDLKGLTKGTYLVRIETAHGAATERIVLE